MFYRNVGPIGNDRTTPRRPTSPPVSTSIPPRALPTMAPAQANFTDTFALAYGSITLIGGLIGYLKANSLASYFPRAERGPSFDKIPNFVQTHFVIHFWWDDILCDDSVAPSAIREGDAWGRTLFGIVLWYTVLEEFQDYAGGSDEYFEVRTPLFRRR